MSLYIVATGYYCENIHDDLPPLKVLVKESVGQSVRRIDRFIQLALIGAGKAAKSIPKEGGIYLASGCGDVEITVELLESIYRDGQVPKPLSFVNSVSNAASFYVAQCLGLHGPSLFVTSRYFAIETALHSAALDIECGKVNFALVGVVDIVLPPVDQHCERLMLEPNTDVAEASFWFQLCSDPGERQVLAQLDRIWNFSDIDLMFDTLTQADFVKSTIIAFGQFMEEVDKQRCLSHFRLAKFHVRSPYGHFNCRSGEIISQFIEQGKGGLLLISGDRYGRFQVFEFTK